MAKLKLGWRRVKFGDVVRHVKEVVDPKTVGLERFVAGEHMDTDDLRLRRWGHIGDGYLGPAFHIRFRPGHVLYGSRRTYLRKVAVADFEGICANTTFVLEPSNPAVLLPELLPFVMQTEAFHAHSKRESKGSVNPYVNFSDLAWFEFVLPPLREQQRLVELSTAMWSTIECTRQLRQRAEDARRSWLKEIVSALLESTPTKRTLGSILRGPPEGGCSAPELDSDTGHHVLALSSLGPAGYVPGELKSVEPTSDMIDAMLATGDLLISRSNTRERVGFVGRFVDEGAPVSFPDTMMRLRPDDQFIKSDFLEMILQSSPMRGEIQAIAAGTSASMKKINRRNLCRLVLPVPSIRRQAELLDRWHAIRSTETHAQSRHEQARILFRCLLTEVTL
ncbi:MAG: restriction endonuclease subunit S [Polyangia bacterium]